MLRYLFRYCWSYGLNTWLIFCAIYLVITAILSVRQLDLSQKRGRYKGSLHRDYNNPPPERNTMRIPVIYRYLRGNEEHSEKGVTFTNIHEQLPNKKPDHIVIQPQIANRNQEADELSAGKESKRQSAGKVKQAAGKDKPAAGKDKPAAGKDKPAAGKDKLAADKDKQAAGKDKPAESKDKPAAGKDKPAESKDKPAEIKDKPAAGKDKQAAGKDKPAESKNKPAESKDEPEAGKDKQAAGKDKQTAGKDKPAESKEAEKQAASEKKQTKKMIDQRFPYGDKKPNKKENTTEHLQPHREGFLGDEGKIILLWTNLTANRPMWNFKTWSLRKCPHKCQITNDRKYLSEATLVLFRLRMLRDLEDKYLREFITAYDVTDLPKTKHPHQVWVDVNQESPMYSHSDEELAAVDKLFDYIVSYHSQSDFTYDYKLLYRKKTTPNKSINYSANKTKVALWYVSHCSALSGRYEYVNELKKYNISVDIFGKCTGLMDGCKGYKDINCVNALKAKYKFYLAFENSICSEYITEKFWNTLGSTSYNIPVALGARVDEYKLLSPPDSFIHVGNFTGAKELAQYLHSVDRDDKKFNSYHSWRETYELYTEKKEPFDCWLCRMAYEQPKTKRTSYSEFWSRKHLCQERPESIK